MMKKETFGRILNTYRISIEFVSVTIFIDIKQIFFRLIKTQLKYYWFCFKCIYYYCCWLPVITYWFYLFFFISFSWTLLFHLRFCQYFCNSNTSYIVLFGCISIRYIKMDTYPTYWILHYVLKIDKIILTYHYITSLNFIPTTPASSSFPYFFLPFLLLAHL